MFRKIVVAVVLLLAATLPVFAMSHEGAAEQYVADRAASIQSACEDRFADDKAAANRCAAKHLRAEAEQAGDDLITRAKLLRAADEFEALRSHVQ